VGDFANIHARQYKQKHRCRIRNIIKKNGILINRHSNTNKTSRTDRKKHRISAPNRLNVTAPTQAYAYGVGYLTENLRHAPV